MSHGTPGKRRRGRRLVRVSVVAGAGLVAIMALLGGVRYPRHRPVVVEAPGVWRGAFHVHTTVSDGAGTIDQVAREAREAGLTWVVLTDHNVSVLEPTRYLGGILLVSAVEVSTRWGHVAVLGLSRPLSPEERRGDGALDTIRGLGGAAIASHPLGPRRPFRDLDATELAGLEVISGDSLLRETLRSPLRLPVALLAYPVNPMHAAAQLIVRPDAVLEAWDRLLARRRVAGFFAHDAHGRPSYGLAFRLMSTYAHVDAPPTGDAEVDGPALIGALIAGRAHFGFDAFAPAGGFDFGARTPAGRVPMGGEVRLAEQPELEVTLAADPLPPGVAPYLRCNGREVPLTPEARGGGVRYRSVAPAPGGCRVEVLHEGRFSRVPWMLSNPIYVR